MNKSIVFVLALALFSAVLIQSDRAQAVGGAAPSLSAESANCFQNIVETGDIYCLLRYELPTYTTASPPPVSAEGWCAELVDQDGCTDDPVEPTAETSLITDTAFVTLYQNCGASCASGTLESQVRAPRINHALGGAYLAGGNAVTWGDTTVLACVESSATLYTVQSQSCVPVGWNAASVDETTQRDQLGATLIGELRTLETERNLALNSYVSNGVATTAGRTLAVEALSIMDQVIPDYFQAASSSALSETEAWATPIPGSLALQASIDATAAATDLPAAFADLGSTAGGLSGGAMATVFFGAIGTIFFVWIHQRTGEYVIPSAGFITVGLVGLWARGPTLSVIGVAALVLALLGGMFVIYKVRA